MSGCFAACPCCCGGGGGGCDAVDVADVAGTVAAGGWVDDAGCGAPMALLSAATLLEVSVLELFSTGSAEGSSTSG